MDRRRFLMTAGVASATLALPKTSRLFALGLTPVPWRTFEVTTRVEVLKPAGTTRVWLPAALLRETPFQKTLANEFRAEGGKAELIEERNDALGIVSAEFPEGVAPVLTLTCRVSTRDWAVDLSKPGKPPAPNQAELDAYRKGTRVVPTDGIVREKALEITRGKTTDVAKARCLYDWIVDNTYRNPKTRGCGLGDVKFLLESGDLGGKCADLNALYVALARAAGLPARDVYGVRVAKSELGYKSLGPSTEIVSKAQHCRAEVWLDDYGWIPVDPADVRKVVLEEPPGNLPIDDSMVKAARERLFGSWEMNWIALNFGHDVALPGSKGAPINYFMYPQAETGAGRLDPLDPDAFKYQIIAKELPAAS
ncbi:MAG TPA: transglutaminase-like domain-containing protein [Thermoanaerobaculia bacterium]|nr:transglutaminase-like domain-containing protein [Thermoanaerobaculia bacterium]